jgi:hypothetical protein
MAKVLNKNIDFANTRLIASHPSGVTLLKGEERLSHGILIASRAGLNDFSELAISLDC